MSIVGILKNNIVFENKLSIIVILLTLVCFYPYSHAEEKGVIEGRIINLTTGKEGYAGKLTLFKLSGGMEEITVMRNVRGEFKIDDVNVDANYIIQIEYLNVTYNSSVQFSKNNKAQVNAVVYEKSGSAEDVSVIFPHMMIKKEGNGLLINKIFELDNKKNPKKVFYNEQGTFNFYLPEKITGDALVSASTGAVSTNQEYSRTEKENVYKISYPVKPGKTRIEISYKVDYSDKTYRFEERLLYDIETLAIITFPESLVLSGKNLESVQYGDSRGMRMYALKNIKAGETAVISVSGGEEEAGQRRIVQVHPLSNQSVVLLILLICVIIAGGIFLSSIIRK